MLGIFKSSKNKTEKSSKTALQGISTDDNRASVVGATTEQYQKKLGSWSVILKGITDGEPPPPKFFSDVSSQCSEIYKYLRNEFARMDKNSSNPALAALLQLHLHLEKFSSILSLIQKTHKKGWDKFKVHVFTKSRLFLLLLSDADRLSPQVHQKTVGQIVHLYNKQASAKSRFAEVLKKILEEALLTFDQSLVSFEKVIAIAPIAACNNTEIVRSLLNIVIDKINGSTLLEPALIEGIGIMIRYALSPKEGSEEKHKSLDASDMKEILKALFSKMETLHSKSTKKILGILECLTNLINTMVDVGVDGLPQESLQSWWESLKDISAESSQNFKVSYYSGYCREAIARLEDSEGKFVRYFGHGFSLLTGTLKVAAGFASFDPVAILESLKDMKDTTI
jgi:hypothetical protein